MFKYLTQKWKQKRGFTLMEVMVVVAILAVIAGIAIPSVINMRKNMKFTERNDYAKAIFMAAQANLTEMRSKGELSLIIPEDGSAKAVIAQADGTPPPSTYIYTWNSEASIFDCVLPANSIDSAVRNGQIIIEYNPAAGIVYSVFYYDDDDMDLKAQYASSALTRDEEGRKELLLGYYSVGNIDALDAQALDVYQLASTISFTNSDEALLTISVPSQTTDRTGAIVNIFEKVQGGTSGYTQRMEIALTISGENTNSFTVIGKSALVDATLGETGVVSYTTKTGSSVGAVPIVDFIFTLDSLNENKNFKKIIDAASGGTANTTGFRFGDNVSITADITFYPTADDPIVMIESSTIAGINPLFHSLTQNPEYDAEIAKNNVSYAVKPYILAISNARHLQNLEYLAENHSTDPTDTFIKQIASIVFVEKQAVTNNPPDNDDSGSDDDGSENGEEAENKAIQPLSASSTESENSGNTETETTTEGIAIKWTAEAGINAKFSPIDLSKLSYVPKIIGNGVEIHNLKIEKDTGGNTGASIGLFAEMKDASIEGITLVDPIITNNSAFLTGSNITDASTTGALIGTADGVTIKDCSVVSSSETFCISGNQFVGGLVGYVKGISSFEDCEADVFVTNINDSVQSTDQIPHILGGLVGYVEGSTATGSTPIAFTNCTTTATVTATTATDLGGMAGKAENASFIGCSTEATVTGADGVLSNIGGLVGYAESVNFDNCDANANGAKVTSGEMTNASGEDEKNTVGGLVGYAGTATGGSQSTFKNCDISEKASVVSANYAHSNIGGLVGYANGAKFETCSSKASVTGTQPVLNEAPTSTIPNNNLGGIIGYSLNCEYQDIDVTLKTRPEYAEDAGGFAGILKGGTVNDLVVNLELSSGSDVSGADTLTYFGGIASRCNGGASVTHAGITIKGTMNNVASQAAGAFSKTGGDSSATLSDIRVNLSEATLASAQTAGLIVHNGSNSEVEKSYARGKVVGNSDSKDRAGFVFQNDGIIEQCFANVTMSQGNSFVTVNNGTIKNCYGWVWDSGSNVKLEIEKRCSRSYFVNGETDEMILYEGLTTGSDTSAGAVFSEKSKNILDTSALTDIWALDILNTGVTDSKNYAWKEGNADYPYPTLVNRTHVDKYAKPNSSSYPFGLIYEETYSDGSKGYTINNFSSTAATPTVPNMPKLSDSESINGTAFYLYHRTDSNLGTGSSYNKFDWLPLNRLYTIYPLDSGITKTVDGVSINTYYPLSDNQDYYRIRTSTQFDYIEEKSDKVFVVERNVTPTKSVDSFSGTISGSAAIDASKINGNLVGTLEGTLNGLTVTGLKAPMVNEISGGTVTGCDVSGKIESGENVGIIAGTMTSDSIADCKVTGSVSGNGYVGGVVGRSAGNITGVKANLSMIEAIGKNTQVGALAGYASSGEISNCTITAPDGVAFANFPERDSLHEDAQYISRYDHGAENDINIVSGPALNMLSIEGRNDTLITADVSVSACTLNKNTVPITHVYYYHRSDLKCTSPDKAFAFITMNEDEGLKFNELYDEYETVYYVEVANKVYEAVTSVSFSPDSSDDDATYTFTYSTDSLGGKSIKNIKLSEKVSNSGLKMYTKSTSDPNSKDGSYLIFNQSGNEILIYNEAGFAWVVYDVKYYSHMIWVCQDGIWTNAYMPDGKVTVGDAVGFTTANLTYGDKTTVCQLYPVTAYRTVKRVDSANILDGSDLT